MKRNIKIKSLVNPFGISLIEVMIVVAITGVIIALVLPDFNRLIGRYSLECVAREMVSDIRALQQNAIKDESFGYCVLFDNAADCYQLINTGTGVNAYKTIKLPAGVNLERSTFDQTNDKRLFFTASGNPFGGIGGHITLQDRVTEDYLYVIIDSVGRVRISKSAPK
ncbi:MAG: hypothetical protein A4E52_01430 [Pelotomaculum sp. PtaB.Bin013]|uniref:Prepilin-type N-terminal cleavage/methylation domain-containing protein n=1 Tax=Pelotomaculum isophthalicicum JI TaxID=947010 RepID=A0A9X4H2T0_9FIRM|nr:hypothetical protein [Pelotomaculum isophthalicicum]MDF9408611.1 hypothetical protein [Pelotomaculum isophthalicicum JI]OPX87093.1 MAG: hypothetical protein A4E52_01430 [Pelotomaculum sp. PtaB.Bin013]